MILFSLAKLRLSANEIAQQSSILLLSIARLVWSGSQSKFNSTEIWHFSVPILHFPWLKKKSPFEVLHHGFCNWISLQLFKRLDLCWWAPLVGSPKMNWNLALLPFLPGMITAHGSFLNMLFHVPFRWLTIRTSINEKSQKTEIHPIMSLPFH